MRLGPADVKGGGGSGVGRNVPVPPWYDPVPQSPRMLPNPMLVRTRMIRGAASWVAIRALLGIGLAMAGFDPVRLRPTVSLGVIALCVVAAAIDEMRHGEGVLIGNLGVSRLWCAAIDVVPPLLGELVVLSFGLRLG